MPWPRPWGYGTAESNCNLLGAWPQVQPCQNWKFLLRPSSSSGPGRVTSQFPFQTIFMRLERTSGEFGCLVEMDVFCHRYQNVLFLCQLIQNYCCIAFVLFLVCHRGNSNFLPTCSAQCWTVERFIGKAVHSMFLTLECCEKT